MFQSINQIRSLDTNDLELLKPSIYSRDFTNSGNFRIFNTEPMGLLKAQLWNAAPADITPTYFCDVVLKVSAFTQGQEEVLPSSL